MKVFSTSIEALMIFSMKVFHTTASEDAAVPLVITSTQEKRLLNTCKTFLHDGGTPGEWRVDGTGLTLKEACDPNLPGGGGLDCCHSGGTPPVVNGKDECTLWNIRLPYTLCDGACQGPQSCQGIAGQASGGSVKINSNACQDPSRGYACTAIAYGGGRNVNVEVESGSCVSQYACHSIAFNALGGSVTIKSNSCKQDSACYRIGHDIPGYLDVEVGTGSCNQCSNIGSNSQSLTRIEVPPGQCMQAGTCGLCGVNSVFEGTFQATDACCMAVASSMDEECNGSQAPSKSPTPSNLPSSIPSNLPSSMPSDLSSEIPSVSSVPSDLPSEIPSVSSVLSPPTEEPNPCQNVSCSKRGKCQVLSLTEAACQCENTFIQSENKLDCICPSNYEFHAHVNRCLPPPTVAPTNSPTKSPTLAPTASPTASPIIKTDECIDDMSGTFQLANVMEEVECSWLTKNKDKTDIRKAKYCGIDEVKSLCKSTCEVCTECNDNEGTFSLLNVKKRVTCAWLTRNKLNAEIRKNAYCALDEVRDMCKASCGACAVEWEYLKN